MSVCTRSVHGVHAPWALALARRHFSRRLFLLTFNSPEKPTTAREAELGMDGRVARARCRCAWGGSQRGGEPRREDIAISTNSYMHKFAPGKERQGISAFRQRHLSRTLRDGPPPMRRFQILNNKLPRVWKNVVSIPMIVSVSSVEIVSMTVDL